MPGESDSAVVALAKKVDQLNTQVALLESELKQLRYFYQHTLQEHLLNNFICWCAAKENQ